ncbi:cell division protein FtsA [Roseomonas populi]|uniref:Cell division protein FtsA n=1 Tax=Roseomonas populi TaxID=3121582 RepID=A0ABT1XBB5_9PROT|nr:cell division protein FtsA [Roseomonas pecuniae]MCR0984422.1 cell division protein FtsA [Roseomonas pecuniae]
MNAVARVPDGAGPGLPPARPRHPRARNGNFGVLDIGSTKIVCVIARIEPDGLPRALGYGWQRSHGVKGGNITDLAAAERAIRAAVAHAEEMAHTKLSGVIVNLSCGQPGSRQRNVQWTIGGRAVTEADLRAMVNEGRRRMAEEGREAIHALPLNFTLDATPGVSDPRGMIGESLGVRLHIVDAASASLRNLGTGLLRCDLEVEEPVSAPYAAALSALAEDERELGATVIDMGGGTTTLAVVHEGLLLHTAQVPVGGWQVTNDLARGLSTPLDQAERLKTMYGSLFGTIEDEREMLSLSQIGEDGESLSRVPRAQMLSIIRPRVEETLELVRDRLAEAHLGPDAGQRVVLTGGASQLVGMRETAARILGRQVRLGRPAPVRGLPEAFHAPGFATTLGLVAWGGGEGRPALDFDDASQGSRSVFARFVNWLRDRV